MEKVLPSRYGKAETKEKKLRKAVQIEHWRRAVWERTELPLRFSLFSDVDYAGLSLCYPLRSIPAHA